VPLHRLHEKGYAESEISISPYPPQLGIDSRVSTELHNASDVSITVNLEFGWAKFGMGIPFSTTGMSPISRTVTVHPHVTNTAWVSWTPAMAGHQCVRVLLSDVEGRYEPQESQRNVDVEQRTFCGTNTFTVTVHNDSPFTQTVDVGLMTFNVPPGWQVTTVPSGTMELGPFSEGAINLIVKIPCPSGGSDLLPGSRLSAWRVQTLQEAAGSVPTVDVEGYIEGELVGGIEIRFEGRVEWPHGVFLPLILRSY
jgi:hypothetical protein